MTFREYGKLDHLFDVGISYKLRYSSTYGTAFQIESCFSLLFFFSHGSGAANHLTKCLYQTLIQLPRRAY